MIILITSTLLQEDERKERELLQKQKEEQLRIDEELAKSLFENYQDPVAVVRGFKQKSSSIA